MSDMSLRRDSDVVEDSMYLSPTSHAHRGLGITFSCASPTVLL